MSSHALVHRTLLPRQATADLFRMRDQRAALSYAPNRANPMGEWTLEGADRGCQGPCSSGMRH